jgi:hypothetical protein
VDGRWLESHIVRNLERMAAIALDLNLAGPALVSVSLDGTEDVELTRARSGTRPFRRPEIILPSARIGDLSEPIAESLHEQLDILWQAGGWGDGSPSFAVGTWAGYTDKQNYDFD